MFRPEPMRHVLIQVVRDDLPQAALTLAALGSFAPDRRVSDEHELEEVPGERYRQLFRQAESRLSKITSHFQDVNAVRIGQTRLVSERELDALNNRLGSLWQECSVCQEDFRLLDDEVRLVDQLENALETFANLNIDLSLLQGKKEFLDLRLGVVPSINLERMRDALSLADYLVYTFLKTEDSVHVVVVGPIGDKMAEVDSVIESAGFRALPVPAELHDEPTKIRQELNERRTDIERRRDAVRQQVEHRAAQSKEFIEQAIETLALAEPYVQLDNSARGSSYLAVISGWVPKRDLAAMDQTLQHDLEHPFNLTSRSPRANERHEVPTLLKSHRLLAPFSTLVRQYGIPRYGEFDPTALFAITFVLMFGMMFGDIGHGARERRQRIRQLRLGDQQIDFRVLDHQREPFSWEGRVEGYVGGAGGQDGSACRAGSRRERSFLNHEFPSLFFIGLGYKSQPRRSGRHPGSLCVTSRP